MQLPGYITLQKLETALLITDAVSMTFSRHSG